MRQHTAIKLIIIKYTMIKKSEPKHGGKRKNAGRKKEYDEPTTTIALRVPKSKVKEVKRLVTDFLKPFKHSPDNK